MLRHGTILTVALAMSAICQPARANWFQELYGTMKRDWHRNNCWPQPFVKADRMHVNQALEAVVVSGWRHQNLLGQHHFTSDAASLTTSGQLKLREILTQGPTQFRTVFVERGQDRDVTAARLDAVEQWAANHLPEVVVADVQESDLIVEGRPAQAVDAINVRFQETRPIPQLPAPSTVEF